MILKADDGRTLRVDFWHSKPGYFVGGSRVTKAHLLDEAGREVAQGSAWCNPKDEFRKETGRKLALARAMKALGLGREERAGLWASYLEQRGFVVARV